MAGKMKPIIIVQPGVMSKEDIQKLNDNELCVVEADDPAKVRFLDPIPAAADRSKVEQACIELSRILLNGKWSGSSMLGKSDMRSLYYDCLINGTPLDPKPSIEELERTIIDEARKEELKKIGREEVRANYEAKKAAKAKPKQ